MAKHKRAGSKHRLAGPIGKTLGFNFNGTSNALAKEKKLGLERNKVFFFAPSITAMATPTGKGTDGKGVEATFSRATFEWSDEIIFYFHGESIDKKNRHHPIMSFQLTEDDLKGHIRLEVGTSLGGVKEGEE